MQGFIRKHHGQYRQGRAGANRYGMGNTEEQSLGKRGSAIGKLNPGGKAERIIQGQERNRNTEKQTKETRKRLVCRLG